MTRILAVLWNTYREAVRARLLLGLFALALATAGYALIVAQYASRNATRVVSDLGAASASVYAIVAALVLGATSLHREVELKTVFPILARPIRRGEYLVGKFFGMLLLLAVFVAGHAATSLICLSTLVPGRAWRGPLVALLELAVLGGIAWRARSLRTALPGYASALLLATGWWLTAELSMDRRVVLGSALLTVLEVSIVVALALLFSSFSSPFLTAVFTFGVLIVGRSADTLAHLPARVFGEVVHDAGEVLSHVFPNLMVYLPPRSLISGESATVPLVGYLARAAGQSFAWCLGLLALATAIFQKRDFT